MNQIKKINPQRVKLFKNLIHGLLEGCQKSELRLEPLEAAAAAEEFAAELRKKSAEDFGNCPPLSFPRPAGDDDGDKPKSYPEWIGG